MNIVILNNDQINYISTKLQESLKSIEKAYEDNKIFYECDQIEANEEAEVINSILNQLHRARN